MAAYVVAVLQRTSLGVSGLDAARRFDASASVLASFAVLQLLVYASLQVPVGLLVDRFGPRRLIVGGAVLMATGQFVLALADHVPLAVLGRVLVGAGDAMTFISVLRLVTAWLPPGPWCLRGPAPPPCGCSCCSCSRLRPASREMITVP